MRISILRLGLFLSLSGIVGCPSTLPDSADNTNTTVPSTTKILDSQTLDALESVSADLSTLTFSRSTPVLDTLEPGDMIVSDVRPPSLPSGLLRRVESVSTSGTTAVVSTSSTGLAQAVEKGEIHTRIPLRSTDLPGNVKGATSMAGPGQLVFPFNDIVLFDGDNDPSTTDDQILMSGNLAMEPDVVIDLEFGNFTLQKATIEVTGNATASVSIEARRKATFDYEDTLLTIPFPAVTIPLGPIPVVFIPILELRAGADGTFSASTEADLTLDANTTVGFGYDGGFGPILEIDPSGEAQVPSFADGATAEGKVWLGARFKVAVYGIAGAFVDSKFYGRTSVDVNGCPWWQLFAGVEGSAGAFAGVLDVNIFEWQTNPLKKEVPLSDAGGCAPSTTAEGLTANTWAYSFGNTGIEYPVAVAGDTDGGVVVAGSTSSYTSGSLAPDALLFKVDKLGHLDWQVGFDDLQTAVAVSPVPDGYLLLAGEVSTQTEEPSYLLHLNENGVPVWAKSISSAASLDATSMALLPGGDIVLAGNLGDLEESDVWIARFSSSGTPVWAVSTGGATNEQVKSMIVDSAGNILLLVDSDSFVGGSKLNCNWTIKLDPAGNILWQNCYAGVHFDAAGAIVEVPGGYALIGHLGSDAEMNRIDTDGQLLWARHFDAKTEFDRAYASAALPNGNLLVLGRRGLGQDADLWAFRLSDQGEFLWSRTYGGSGDDEGGGFSQYASLASTVSLAPDGGVIMAGITNSFGAGNFDTWLLKIRDVGSIALEAQSGATSKSLSSHAIPLDHTVAPGVSSTKPLTLVVEDYLPTFYSPTLQVSRQGGLPN